MNKMQEQVAEFNPHESRCIAAIDLLVNDSHGAAVQAGWYTDPRTGQDIVRNDGEQLMLIVSEIAEAMEGIRKNLQDDKLAQFKMRDVEIVDALIRCFDILGKWGTYSPGEIYVLKRRYNDRRADHKPENRAKEGGKAF